MNENIPSGEYESRPMSSVMHYYYAINESTFSEDRAVMAVSNLIDSLPNDSEIALSSLFDHDAFPDDWQYDADPTFAAEKLALLPLLYISPTLEVSDFPIDDLKKWHSEILLGLRTVVQDSHGPRCLKGDPDCHYDSCANSIVCPRRVMMRFLTKNLVLPDFTNGAYVDNPQRAYQIALDKLDIGVERGILLEQSTNRIRSLYELQYEQWMHSRRPSSRDSA